MSVRTLRTEQTERFGSPPSRHCPTCKGEGRFRWYVYSSVEWQKAEVEARAKGGCLNAGQIKEYDCSCPDQIVLGRYMDYWGIQALYQKASKWDIIRPEAQKVYEQILSSLDYSLQTGTGLYLHGGHGLGKSLFCALMAKEAINRNVQTVRPAVRFGTFVHLIARWQATWHGHERFVEEQKWFEDEIQNVNLLVIDDLGKESLMENGPSISVIHRMVSELLRQRAQAQLPTLISSNLELDKAVQRYGTDVASILAAFEAVNLEGEDFRIVDLKARNHKEYDLGLTRPIMI
jgi:DNA replication protein DnaC